MNYMSEEIRERLTILETKHEERHGQTLLMLEGISNTQKSLVDAVQQIAINQGKMEHMGGEIDELGDRIGKLEVTQGQHKIAIGGLLFLSSSLLTAGIGMIFWLVQVIKWALIFAVLAIAMVSVAHYVYDKNTIVAVCYDSSVHVVSNRRGSCSHHGGVREWVEI